MPVQWHEENLKRLFLAVLAVNRVDSAAVAKKWLELYESGSFEHPSKRAIELQIWKLKKSVATAAGKMGSEPSPAKSKLANDSRAYSIGDNSDDSEFFDVPIKTRSPSIMNTKQESVAPTASGSSSNAIKAEDAGYDNNVIVVDDSSESEMPPPSRAEQPSSSGQKEGTAKDGSPSNAIRRHASAPARSMQKGSSAYDQVGQAVQAPTDQNRSAPGISGIKRHRIATAGASASKRRLVSKGAMRGPGGQ